SKRASLAPSQEPVIIERRPVRLIARDDGTKWKRETQTKLGDLSEMTLFHNSVLVAVYVRDPDNQQFESGHKIILSDKTVGEDKWQGTVGLVLKKGPAAFVEDDNNRFYGCDVEIGQWVFFRASDGVAMNVKGVLCRRILDILIEGTIPNPDYVY
ncbi:MAG TPA: hypothetical protein VKD45_12445, partial [Hyphomicrobiaceae bacterium]|nr:hypothetical protein [Hyphomicrobiaceae bacterium]